jgi:regulator of replication initiation timing
MEEKPTDPLNDCRETVEQLQEEKKELEVENEQLREASGSFGELAERLNVALTEERQSAEAPAGAPLPASREKAWTGSQS